VLEVTVESQGALPSVEPIRIGQYRWVDHDIELMSGSSDEITHDIRRVLAIPDAEPEHLILRLRLHGIIDLAKKMAVDDALDDLRARVLHLEYDDTGLTRQPTADDLDSIDEAGFVRTAVNRLRNCLDGPQAAVAERALELLYGFHHRDRG
jgi:hypothetical protein